ncbi:MAG: hypothetical protein Q8941_06785 [Bacteroidota bacterium]|nr:hypothetical protein [Bacteroidota bacterium]
MSQRKLSPKQLRVNEIMEETNYNAKSILADEELRNAAQVRVNVTPNKLYTALIKEYFRIARSAMERAAGSDGKGASKPG